jgi:PAS domain S-box-containing protein
MEPGQLCQSILDSISEGVMTLDQDWRIVSWNQAAERITGFHRDEVIGRECMKVFRSALCRANCPVENALSCSRPSQDVQVAIRNKRNEVVHLVVNAAALCDTHGAIVGGVETFRDVSRNQWMQEEMERRYGAGAMVGACESMQRVFEALASLINTDTTVLILGESGTGKELAARALHIYGPRREKPFVAINCSALPEGVLESELFGHAKGAFTGAVRDHTGKFELANGGTLFLDEIGEISQAIQVKLLRVLEEREFQRVGDNRRVKIDVRLITATNKDLYKKVQEGSFRDDLYYRLSVYPLHLPPLRERREDIPLLVGHFMSRFNRQMGKTIQGISEGVLELLENYPWPGNIRELANAIEHAFVHCKGSLLHPSDFPPNISDYQPRALGPERSAAQDKLGLVERGLILKELEEANWRKSVAARRLGMSRSTLWRKMVKYGLESR